jgi:hypothetical protein
MDQDNGWIGEAFVREAATEGQGIGLFDWEEGAEWRLEKGAEPGNKRHVGDDMEHGRKVLYIGRQHWMSSGSGERGTCLSSPSP